VFAVRGIRWGPFSNGPRCVIRYDVAEPADWFMVLRAASVATEGSIVPEGAHRIDAAGAHGGEKASAHGDERQQGCRCREYQGVVALDLI
jgi:hypothetical protein